MDALLLLFHFCCSGCRSASCKAKAVLAHVEYRAVRVYATYRSLPVPVGHMVFRGDYPFQCSVRCSRAVTTNAQHPLATVGVADSEHRDTIGRSAVID